MALVSIKSKGIVIKRINFGEADKLVTIYSQDFGKVCFVAKGVRKMNSKKKGSLEMFTHISFSAYRNKGIGALSEVETINCFPLIRDNLKKIATACEISEMVDKITGEEIEQEEIYYLLSSSLIELEKSENSEKIIQDFGIKLLKYLGYLERNKTFENINSTNLIEEIIEREIKSKKFLSKI